MPADYPVPEVGDVYRKLARAIRRKTGVHLSARELRWLYDMDTAIEQVIIDELTCERCGEDVPLGKGGDKHRAKCRY